MTNLRSIRIQGTNDAGELVDIPVDEHGHIEVALHSPTLPFGALHAENLTPIFQCDAVYGINPRQINSTTGHLTGGVTSATNTGTGNLFKCSTGTTALSFASMQSRERLRYRAGEGAVLPFTMMYSTPVASSILVAGCGTGESGFFFGYNGTSFGVLHSTGGVREIQTLTVTTGSSTAENITINLAGTAFLVAVTNSGSTTKTAYEISQGTYAGWKAEQRGATVVFLADAVGNKTGTFSISGATTAVGSFAETLAGVAATDTWVAQTNWNGDKLDGTGVSGVTIDPSKMNVGRIMIEYLGAGVVVMQIMVVPANSNQPKFVDVHTFNFPNTLSAPSHSQPSYPFTMAAYSSGSTTNVWVACASFAGFIAGQKKLSGPRLTFHRETSGYVGSTAATYYPMVTIRNSYCHSHSITERANQSVVNVISMSCSHDDATPVGFFLIRNAVLAGAPNFSRHSTFSCSYWDVAATTCTISSNGDLIASINTGQAAGETIQFDDPILLQPGESLTLAARAVTGTATYVNASLNAREDQ